MAIRIGCAILAAWGVLAGCGSTATEPAPAVPGGFFGVNAQLLQPLPSRGAVAQLQAHLDSLAQLRVDFARANLDWRIIEPLPPTAAGRSYDFTTTDAWVEALARHRVRWQVTGQGVPTPDWARDPGADAEHCDYRSPPARPEDFGALMAAIAKRYGQTGSFWTQNPDLPREPIHQYEIWNEPNYSVFWCPAPDPEAYAALYAASREAIHAVDPQAQVLFGGLAGFEPGEGDPRTQMPPEEFLRRALAAVPELASTIDVLAVHPYGQTPDEVLEKLGWFRSIADATGLERVPLSVNEFGWRTMGSGPAPLADEETRAGYVAELVPAIAGSSCDVIALALHTWITPETNPVDPESWYGIADPVSGDRYPTADAYRDQIEAIAAGDPVDELAADPCVPDGA